MARALDAIGDWWSLLILREAFAGKRRFSEFQKSLGVARNILTARLKKLVAHGVFEQVPASDGSAFHEYALTERGRGLYIVLMALRQWGETCLYGDDGPKYQFVDAKSGKPIKRLELRSHNGKLLQPEDVRIVPIHGESEATSCGKLASVAESSSDSATRTSRGFDLASQSVADYPKIVDR